MKWTKVYFDLDNTLFSHEYAFEQAIQDCFDELVNKWEEKNHGLASHVATEDWFDVFKYYSDYYWSNYENKKWTQKEYRRQRYKATMNHFKLPYNSTDADWFHDMYYERANQYVKPYPGMNELLSYLAQQKQVELGVITNGKTRVQWDKYYGLKLYRYIVPANFIISDDVGKEKPDPAIFQIAQGKAQPADCLFIGDAWELDVVGALQTGWAAIYLNTQHRPRETNHAPVHECSNLLDLLNFFHKYTIVMGD